MRQYDINNIAKILGLVSGYIEDGHKKEGVEVPEFQVTIVWYTYILGGYKALVFSPQMTGRYYEVTYNAAKGEHYLDVYQKFNNLAIKDTTLKAPLN